MMQCSRGTEMHQRLTTSKLNPVSTDSTLTTEHGFLSETHHATCKLTLMVVKGNHGRLSTRHGRHESTSGNGLRKRRGRENPSLLPSSSMSMPMSMPMSMLITTTANLQACRLRSPILRASCFMSKFSSIHLHEPHRASLRPCGTSRRGTIFPDANREQPGRGPYCLPPRPAQPEPTGNQS